MSGGFTVLSRAEIPEGGLALNEARYLNDLRRAEAVNQRTAARYGLSGLDEAVSDAVEVTSFLGAYPFNMFAALGFLSKNSKLIKISNTSKIGRTLNFNVGVFGEKLLNGQIKVIPGPLADRAELTWQKVRDKARGVKEAAWNEWEETLRAITDYYDPPPNAYAYVYADDVGQMLARQRFPRNEDLPENYLLSRKAPRDHLRLPGFNDAPEAGARLAGPASRPLRGDSQPGKRFLRKDTLRLFQ